jgi:hypothetical protein
MAYTKIYIVLTSLLLLAASCKKDDIIIPESNDPVFNVSGVLDGSEFNLVAGDDGAYMHTMTNVENGVEVFSGIISNDDISFEVGVFDGNLDVEMTGVPSSNIAPIFASISSTPIAILSKSNFENSSNINFIQWFVDGVDRGSNDVSIYEAGKYNVCAEIHFNGGVEKTLCNEVILGFNHNATCMLSSEMLGNGIVRISTENPSNTITGVDWFLNDVFVETSDTLELNLTSLEKVTAKIHFQNGTLKTKSILTNGYNNQINIEDFSAFELQSEEVTSRDFNLRVIVRKLNDTYRSDLTNNVSAKVYISEIEYHGLNDAGKSVYKITGSISCRERKVGTTADVDLDVKFVFGVEIP